MLSSMGHTDQPPTGAGAVRDRWESLHAIVSMAADLVEADPAADLDALVADLERRAEQAHAPAADGVTLATLHSAKGLEWDAVFCVGMHEGMMPSVHADTPVAIEEERRLFYVGLTRARNDLMISWATTRRRGGRGNRGPTRFLDTLLPANHEARQTAKQPRDRKVRQSAGSATRSSPSPTASSVAAPTARRPTTRRSTSDCAPGARPRPTEQAKPAYVIFTDATLQSIAEVKPTDEAALAAVPGIGPAKLEKYAEPVLALVSEAR